MEGVETRCSALIHDLIRIDRTIGQARSYDCCCYTEDCAKIDFPFLFRISGFPPMVAHKVAVLRGLWRVLWAMGRDRLESRCLGDRAPVTLGPYGE